MPFKKGIATNPNGRPKGSKNRATENLRDKVSIFLNDNWETVQRSFDKLEAKERLSFIIQLMKYSIPPLSSIDLTTNNYDHETKYIEFVDVSKKYYQEQGNAI